MGRLLIFARCKVIASKIGGRRIVRQGRSQATGWILAILFVGLAIGGLVGGTVLHPILYGLLIASIVIVPLWLASSLVDCVLSVLFGRRK